MGPFRVIILGAGVSGLTASHCLSAAGIAHVVLEKHSDVTPPHGSSISIYPHMMRLLSQLGLYSVITEISIPHKLSHTRNSDGLLIGSNDLFGKIKENHGVDIYPMERREFLKILREGLADKGCVKLGCRVTEIRHTHDGVEVVLADGRVERGDLVIGCDGVHSVARKFMWDHAEKISPSFIMAEEREKLKTGWKCLTGIAPPFTSELTESDMTVVHNRGYSFLLLAQPHCTFFFVFVRLDEDEKRAAEEGKPGHRYTDDDASTFGASLVDHAMTENLTFGQLWEKRSRAMLVSLSEGVLDHWYSGRIVLAGDAAHQVTPNIAWGGNTAMEDVVVLCNLLHGMPSTDSTQLDVVLERYQNSRVDRVKWITAVSGIVSRAQAQISLFWRIVAWLMVYLPVGPAADQLGHIVRDGAKLNFLPVGVEFPTEGRMAWRYS